MANGQISFSVVDGEPYVKVGADTPRPFDSRHFLVKEGVVQTIDGLEITLKNMANGDGLLYPTGANYSSGITVQGDFSKYKRFVVMYNGKSNTNLTTRWYVDDVHNSTSGTSTNTYQLNDSQKKVFFGFNSTDGCLISAWLE